MKQQTKETLLQILILFLVTTAMFSIFFFGIRASLKKRAIRRQQLFEAWEKQTGNPKELTKEQFDVLVDSELLKVE